MRFVLFAMVDYLRSSCSSVLSLSSTSLAAICIFLPIVDLIYYIITPINLLLILTSLLNYSIMDKLVGIIRVYEDQRTIGPHPARPAGHWVRQASGLLNEVSAGQVG